WRAPAPKSKPSSTTKAAAVTAIKANQMVSMSGPLSAHRYSRYRHNGRPRVRPGAVPDLPPHQVEERQAEHEVEAGEAEAGEHRLPSVHRRRGAVDRTQEAVDQPGLPPQLGRHPAGGVGDVGEGEGEHQEPEDGAA